jgi:AsmA protein
LVLSGGGGLILRMQKLIRFLLYFIGALVVLGIALSILLGIFIDPNDYREDISAAVSDATGRTLTIEGELELQTFPCCGIRLGALELSNPTGYPDTHFARVENAAVSVRLMPLLLSQELLVGNVELDGLDLVLISRADGSTNWEFGDSTTDAASEPEPAADSGSGLSSLGVAGITLSNGRILYRDELTGEEIEVGDIQLSTNEISDGEPFELDASLQVSGLAPDTKLAAELTTGVVLNAAAGTLDIAGLEMRLDVTGADLPGGAAQVEVKLADASNLGADEFTLAGLAAVVRAAGLTISVDAAGKVTGETPVLTGGLAIEPFTPRALLKELGEPPLMTADPAVLSNASVTADWELDGDVAKLANINLKLDETTATGWLRVASIEQQRLEFELQFDALDVDRYSAPVTEVGGGVAAETETSDALDLPVDDMRALDLNGRLGFGSLRVAEALLTNVDITVKAKDGLIRMHPLTADIYGGGYGGDIRLDVRGETPKVSMNENLTGFRLGEFLQETQDNANLVGSANISVKGNSHGNAISELTANLAGDAAFELLDGKYLGVDLWYEIRKARASIKGREKPVKPAEPYTDISEVSATATFKDGVVSNRDLRAQIPLILLTGSGDINLIDSVMDYRLKAKVTGTKQFDDGSEIDDFDGITIPVRLKGDIENPAVKVELGKVMADIVEREAKKKLLKKLGLDEPDKADDATDNGDDKSSDPKEQLKKSFRDLLGR